MPSPAFEKLKRTVGSTVTTALAAGDKAYRTAAPVVRRTAEDVVARVKQRDGSAPPAPGAPDASPAPDPAPEATVTPARIAKNVAPARPTAAPAPAAVPDPEDSPGGKLPPRR